MSDINSEMGDTLYCVYFKITRDGPGFQLWDKSQVIVVMIRENMGKTLFWLGEKLNNKCAGGIYTNNNTGEILNGVYFKTY